MSSDGYSGSSSYGAGINYSEVESEYESQSSDDSESYCRRCGRMGHPESACYAKKDVDGRWIYDDVESSSDDSESGSGEYDVQGCARCGRASHATEDCYARTAVDGTALRDDNRPHDDAAPRAKRARTDGSRLDHDETPSLDDEQVYVLELEGGRVYVGKTRDLERRLAEHENGEGAAFTEEFLPTGRQLPLLSTVRGHASAQERHETLCQMRKYGVDNVRGGPWTRKTLTTSDLRDIERSFADDDDLCRRCGATSHFVSDCSAKYHQITRRKL